MKIQVWSVLGDEGKGFHPVGKIKTSIDCSKVKALDKAWNVFYRGGLNIKIQVSKESVINV